MIQHISVVIFLISSSVNIAEKKILYTPVMAAVATFVIKTPFLFHPFIHLFIHFPYFFSVDLPDCVLYNGGKEINQV